VGFNLRLRFFDNGDDITTVADSMIAAMAGNLGIYNMLILFLLTFYLWYRTDSIDWQKLMPVVGVYLLFSFTTIISEAYPMNLLLTFLMWSSPALERHTAKNNKCEVVYG